MGDIYHENENDSSVVIFCLAIIGIISPINAFGSSILSEDNVNSLNLRKKLQVLE